MKRGRRTGTSKGDKAEALALRKQGKSNEQIAETLGVSPRTITRYFTKPKHLSKSVTTNWQKLFKVNESTAKVMELFILRYTNAARWRAVWGESTEDEWLSAIACKRRFEGFLSDCQTSYHDTYFDLSACVESGEYDDSLWHGPKEEEFPF